jgi:lipopolysaccharide transport system ATP-binding protein
MSDLAIQARDIRKRFVVGERLRYRTLRDVLASSSASTWQRIKRAPRPASGQIVDGLVRPKGELWAVDGVSFDVNVGEVVGIIGRNGAGKSTLLKILSRITEPTEGSAEIRGRVGSLLEVGTGFHPELTGRENVFLNGAILGMRRAEIQRKLDEIVTFAGVSRFIDTPVKHYSSGMYLRLAFSVAAHLEPEILFVDEALAVGDAEFQRKCLGKMNDIAREGRTVVFVSHNLLAVQDLCQRVIWMDGGRIIDDGTPGPTISRYLQASLSQTSERSWDDPDAAPGTRQVRLHRASVRPADCRADDILTVRTALVIELEYWIVEPETYMYASIYLYNEQGVLLFNSGPPADPDWRGRPAQAGRYRDVCHIPGDLLNNGVHRVTLEIVNQDAVYRETDLLVFDVQDTVGVRDQWYGQWEGAIRPILHWEGARLDAATRADHVSEAQLVP